MVKTMGFLDYLSANSNGIWVLLGMIAAAVLFIQWLAWIFNKGRYSRPKDSSQSPVRNSIRFLLAEALAKIINDFRHLLALILVSIFGIALFYVMLKAGGSFDNMLEGVQAVAAALGGLIGSIMGYYFGESSAKPAISTPVGGNTTPDEIEQGDQHRNGNDDIRPAPVPPPPPPPSDSSERNDHEGI